MLIICSKCGKEYSNQAKSCPHCGTITSQNRYISNNNNYQDKMHANNGINKSTGGSSCGAILAIVLLLGLFFIGYKLFFGALGELGIEKDDIKSSLEDAWNHDSKKSETKSSYEYTKTYNIGDKITTNKFEITVTDVTERSKVGTQIFNESASDGNTFLCVRIKIKNISSEPIKTFSQPTFNLIDSKNVTYSSDISASAYYATEVNTTANALSDLNPDVSVTDAYVFELGKSHYFQNTFNLKINADKTILVKIK